MREILPENSFFNEEQRKMQGTVKQIIDQEINPYVDEWEEAGAYPAHKVFKKLGDAGLLGMNKPEEYGGLGLDFKWNIAFNEALGNINCGGVCERRMQRSHTHKHKWNI